ncbi:MAG: hypothetical protein M1833_007062 [Piccolia ochrophora]|nr:MAG: hypothetical protein M1833_007062 [Piccolia ochrophora]
MVPSTSRCLRLMITQRSGLLQQPVGINNRNILRRSPTSKNFSGIVPVKTLEDDSVTTFRLQCFNPEVPALLPRHTFRDFPAIGKWFAVPTDQHAVPTLAHDYLASYGQTHVPLELSTSQGRFQRFDAPLSLFLEWTVQASLESSERLYLAQATVSDLPEQLRADLPVPQVVARSGRGDIYDANIWLGLAPTYTPLHRDPNPNLFVQLCGAKMVRIVKPDVGSAIYHRTQQRLGQTASAAFRGDEMMMGEEKGLLEDAVWKDDASESRAVGEIYEARLESGDGLFIPKGWWHSIKGVGQGITGS